VIEYERNEDKSTAKKTKKHKKQ